MKLFRNITAYLLLFSGLLFFNIEVYGQPTEKSKVETPLRLGYEFNYFLSGSSYFFVRGNYDRGDETFGLLGNSPFSERNLGLGYERFLREKWQVGVWYRRFKGAVAGRRNYYQGYVRHNGTIGSLLFVKSFSLTLLSEVDNTTFDNGNNVEFGLSAYLGKRYQLGKFKMQTGLQYEAIKWHEPVGDARRINETRMSFRHQIKLKDSWLVELFAQRQTQYFFAEESTRFNSAGQIIEFKPYRKLNLFKPIYGISVRVMLNASEADKALPFILK